MAVGFVIPSSGGRGTLVAMKRLGELLLDSGAIALAELHTALEACHRTGGRLGTHLLRLGYVDEHVLLDALAMQYGVPSVSGAELLRAEPALVRSIPMTVLRRVQAVPFSHRHGLLQVAMTNPRDMAGLEELSSHSNLEPSPFVATESAILNALGVVRFEAQVEPVPETEDESAEEVREAWEKLWQPPRLTPDELLSHRRTTQGKARESLRATFPGLTPIDDTDEFDSETVLDEDTFYRRLQEARHRDEVGSLLLRYASRFLDRLVLFAVHRGRVVGWMARGSGIVVDDVQLLEQPLEQPSVFLNLHRSGAYFLGSIPPGDGNQIILQALVDPAPHEIVMLPVRVKDRAVAFLVGDSAEGGVGVPVQELVALTTKTGVAFEILIMRRKISH